MILIKYEDRLVLDTPDGIPDQHRDRYMKQAAQKKFLFRTTSASLPCQIDMNFAHRDFLNDNYGDIKRWLRERRILCEHVRNEINRDNAGKELVKMYDREFGRCIEDIDIAMNKAGVKILHQADNRLSQCAEIYDRHRENMSCGESLGFLTDSHRFEFKMRWF